MGTLAITKFTTVQNILPGIAADPFSGGWGSFNNGIFGNTNQNLIDGISNIGISPFLLLNSDGNPPYTGSIQFTFDQNTPIFVLDGKPAISFNSLPAGFVISSLSLSFDTFGVNTGIGCSGTVQIASQSQPIPDVNGSTIVFFNLVPHDPILALTFIGYILQITATDPTDNTVASITGGASLSIVGTYSIQSTRWTIQTTGPVHTGSRITITSPSGGLDFSHVKEVNIQYTDTNGNNVTVIIPSIYISSKTPNLLVFSIPIGFGNSVVGDISIYVIGDGTEFSGSVLLGSLVYLFADASGIYRIVKDKTSDSNYDRINIASGGTILTPIVGLLGLYTFEEDIIDEVYNVNDPTGANSSFVLANEDYEVVNGVEEPEHISLIPISSNAATTIEVRIPDPFIETGFLP